MGRNLGICIGQAESTPRPARWYRAAVLNFNHLYYFHVTASEGSVKAAADRLGVTQPTVSEQLRMLEEMGCQLAQGFLLGRPAGADELEGLSGQRSRPGAVRTPSA